VRANYVIGCDGARSAVRGAIGGALHGDAAHQAWGVIDVLAVTDFPDWRMKSFVRSQDEGILMVLPREGGHLVRLYVELDALGEHERAADRGMGPQDIIAKAQRIFGPSARREGGGVVVDLRDRPPPDRQVRRRAARPGGHARPARDAGRRRLPHPQPQGRAGHERVDGRHLQPGLEADLGADRPCRAALLHTYSGERRAAAKGLVEFDHKWARVVGARTRTTRPTACRAWRASSSTTCRSPAA
jgi:phenol 2-monooxygenase